jgi:hypothetical protein
VGSCYATEHQFALDLMKAVKRRPHYASTLQSRWPWSASFARVWKATREARLRLSGWSRERRVVVVREVPPTAPPFRYPPPGFFMEASGPTRASRIHRRKACKDNHEGTRTACLALLAFSFVVQSLTLLLPMLLACFAAMTVPTLLGRSANLR